MSSPLGSILRQATKKPDGKLNILCAPTHERVESYLCKTGHQFYAFPHQAFKTWDETYCKLPANYTILPNQQIYPDLEFDLVLSQNIAGQVQILGDVAKKLHLPHVRYEHTLAYPQWGQAHIRNLKSLSANINVFITENSRKSWLFNEIEGVVIEHGVDIDLFKPLDEIKKQRAITSICNDWPNRDVPCGFKLWQRVTNGLPVSVWGKSPGFSEPASSTQHLVEIYNSSQIFLNTSLLSPVPCVLLEAMACGCACVSTATCEIPTIIENGVNGYITNNEKEMRVILERLLNNPEECKVLGQNARSTILKRFSLDRFAKQWNEIFYTAAKIIFKG